MTNTMLGENERTELPELTCIMREFVKPNTGQTPEQMQGQEPNLLSEVRVSHEFK